MNRVEVKRMCQHLVEHGHPDMSSRYLTLRNFLAVVELDKCDHRYPDTRNYFTSIRTNNVYK